MPTRPSPRSERLGTPNIPAIRFTRGTSFEASLVRVCYGRSGCSPPLDGSDRVSPATGGFYIQASDGSVSLTVAGYDYNSTGLLCWRDFHPQEWQLASLHRIQRAPWPITGAGGRSKRSSRPPRPAASISRTPTSFTPTGSASFSLCWPWPLHSPTQPANGRRNTGRSSSRPTNAALNPSSGSALICCEKFSSRPATKPSTAGGSSSPANRRGPSARTAPQSSIARKRVVYRGIGPQPRAGSGLQDRPRSACPILVGWVPTATAAKFFRASYWNSSLKQALRACLSG